MGVMPGNRYKNRKEALLANICMPHKIKIIFRGMESDSFINKLKSANFNGISLEILKQEDETKTTIESVNNLGILEWESVDGIEGFVYEMKETYKKGFYSIATKNDDNSLFFMSKQYLLSAQQLAEPNYFFNQASFAKDILDECINLPADKFTDTYLHREDEYLYMYVVIELGLNLSIDCKMEGASEDIIGTGERKSLFLPSTYNGKHYYDDDKVTYPSSIIARGQKTFKEFLSKENGSIEFKAVNYRTKIYTGHKGVLDADETMQTKYEERHYHTEYIQNNIFVMVECESKLYLLNKKNVFYRQRPEIQNLKDLAIYKEKEEFMYFKDEEKRNRYSQFIFVHLTFNGLKLKHKELLIEQIGFSETGEIV